MKIHHLTSVNSVEPRRESVIKLCKDCRSAIWAFGLSRPILICGNKFGFEGKLYVVEPKDNCCNYQRNPSPRNATRLGEGRSRSGAPKWEEIFSGRQKTPLAYREKVRFIPLTQGKFAIVDTEDYDWLNQYKWCAAKDRKTYYAHRGSNGKTISMHREIMRAPKGMICDHKNHNGLDNRKSNLRLCTKAQNQYNKAAKKGCSSRYKGVLWRSDYIGSTSSLQKRWRAQICLNRRKIHLGHFFDEIKAALAYDDKAVELFGEFAYLNFPERIELKKWIRKIIWAA